MPTAFQLAIFSLCFWSGHQCARARPGAGLTTCFVWVEWLAIMSFLHWQLAL